MMKSLYSKFAVVAFVLLLGCLVINVSSCAKNTECKGTVTVLDKSTGAAIAGASVKLSATGQGGKPGQVTDQQTTDGSGKTYHTFNLPAIFDVNVTSGSKTGTGILKLEPGENVEVIVRI